MQVRELVWLLGIRLGLTVEDLVLVVMLFEDCITPRQHRGLLTIAAIRRLLLGACLVILKTNRDVPAAC